MASSALLTLLLSVVASNAHAQPEYPGELQDAMGLECPPPCLMCHRSEYGGPSWNAFGNRILALGGAQQKSWAEIISSLRANDADSDSDGELDMAELDKGNSPSVPGPHRIDCPKYGCGARFAPVPTPQPLPALLAIGTVALLLAGRRAGMRRSARG